MLARHIIRPMNEHASDSMRSCCPGQIPAGILARVERTACWIRAAVILKKQRIHIGSVPEGRRQRVWIEKAQNHRRKPIYVTLVLHGVSQMGAPALGIVGTAIGHENA